MLEAVRPFMFEGRIKCRRHERLDLVSWRPGQQGHLLRGVQVRYTSEMTRQCREPANSGGSVAAIGPSAVNQSQDSIKNAVPGKLRIHGLAVVSQRDRALWANAGERTSWFLE
jgi:hypothetical protein